jgi:hypothetical protein
MIRFGAGDFCQALGIFPQVWARLNSGMPIDDQSLNGLAGACGTLQRHCEQLQLPVSLKQIDTIRLQGIASGTSFQTLGRMLTDLYGRLIDELDTRHLLLVRPDKAGSYSDPLKEWDIPLNAFPSIRYDIERAQQCYALDQPTACVFHLMRSLEVPLKSLSSELSIVKHSPTWEAYLSAMATAIQTKFPDKTKAHAERRVYFTALEGQLRAIKTAWRNPTMHEIASVYTEEMSHELIVLVRGFMREAARELYA